MNAMPKSIVRTMPFVALPDDITPKQMRRGLERALTASGMSRTKARKTMNAVASMPKRVEDIEDDDVKALVEAMLG